MQKLEEKKEVQRYLNQIDNANKKINQVNNEALKAQRKIKPTSIGQHVTNEKLRDYILRLKTTSIHSAKYAETLNVLIEIMQYEEETAARQPDKPGLLEQPNSITAQLSDVDNYKFIVKAVQSRDESVIANFLDIAVKIGNFDKYV